MTVSPIKVIELKASVLADNDADAALLREENRRKKVFYVNMMSSPGAGKTTLLLAALRRLDPSIAAAVMEADIDSDVDAAAVREAGFPVVQLHTGGMCHLDAAMSRQGLSQPEIAGADMVFLENVGNLVCPAEFDTGAALNVVLLSIPEGDDKPLKYPLMFEKADMIVLTKIDAAEAFDFDEARFRANAALCNPEARIYPVSSLTGEGMAAWCRALEDSCKAFFGRCES